MVTQRDFNEIQARHAQYQGIPTDSLDASTIASIGLAACLCAADVPVLLAEVARLRQEADCAHGVVVEACREVYRHLGGEVRLADLVAKLATLDGYNLTEVQELIAAARTAIVTFEAELVRLRAATQAIAASYLVI